MTKLITLCCLVCLRLSAQAALTTISVSDETAPPGGMAQVKVRLTSPKPITTGNMSMDLSWVSFDSIDGIALFDGTGDVVGAATVNGGKVNVRFTSPKGTFGTTLDYPILTIALTLSKNAVPGQVFPVILDPAASIWQDLLGAAIPFEFQQGTITVGGSVSITNVVPGGGIVPAGGTFSVYGMGFSPSTKLIAKNFATSDIQYVSPTEFLVTASTGGRLDGTEIIAKNRDKSSDTYFSYMRGVPQGASARPLLAQTVPVFSLLTATEAVLPATISPLVNPDYFTGIAVQNPSPAPASVTVEARSAAGTLLGSTGLVLPTGTRISREVSELFGFALPTGAYVRVVSSEPVQVVGMLGRESTRVVLPLALTILAG